MTPSPDTTPVARDAYGAQGLTWVDRFGVWLSQRAITRHLPGSGALDILELGCGFHARNLAALRPRIRRAVGVDFRISEEARRLDYIQFIEGPIESVVAQLSPKSFDVILFISVLEHLRDPLAVLRGCHEWLRPGGVLLINVPTWLGKVFLEFSAFRLGLSPKEEMDDHKMYYDKRDLWPLLVEAGFAPSRIHMNYHKFRLNLFAVVRKASE